MNTPETRLESWKEIGSYLQRDATTVRRWEKEEGLPVHRHNHKSRSSVYAYPSEIDAWRASRKAVPEQPPARSLWKVPAFALTMLLCLVMVGNGIRPASAQQAGAAPAKRFICEGECADSEYSFSPDGRLMVMTDWASGDLAIRDMSNGQIRRLMAKTGSFRDSGKDSAAYGESPILSPDTRQVAYLWDPADTKGHVQFRIMPNQPGGQARVLIDSPENLSYGSAVWSPDGQSILLLVDKAENKCQLLQVSVASGAVKELTPVDWRLSGVRSRPSYSPDGRYITYAAQVTNPKARRGAGDNADVHIYVMAADGSGVAELVKTAGVNDNPVWAPDGAHLLFTSDRSGSFGLWSIGVQNGKPVGSPALVIRDMNITAMGIHSGVYHYIQNIQGIEYVSVAEIDPSGANTPGPTHTIESFVGQAPVWSPDGKSIAFKRHHPGKDGAWELAVHSVENGDERTYTTNIGITGGGTPWWFHDGQSILSNVSPPGLLHRVDLGTAEFKEAHAGPAGPAAISLDDKTLFAVRPWPVASNMPAAIVAIDLGTGQQREVLALRPGSGGNFLKLSPDGRTLALVRNDPATKQNYVIRVGVDGSGYREIYAAAQAEITTDVAWTMDSRGILLNRRINDKREIVRIPAEGGALQSTGVEIASSATPNAVEYLDVSPDGTRIAYSSSKRTEELWALDNVLSVLK